MSKIDEVRAEMFSAMKKKETARKDSLSALLSALKAKEKDKREPLTEDEENTIVLKEIKQTKETMESAPENRTDIIEECKARIAVFEEFAPKAMSEEEIREVIAKVFADLNIENPSAKDKGIIMKNLMPLVKGKADVGLVNRIVGEMLA